MFKKIISNGIEEIKIQQEKNEFLWMSKSFFSDQGRGTFDFFNTFILPMQLLQEGKENKEQLKLDLIMLQESFLFVDALRSLKVKGAVIV